MMSFLNGVLQEGYGQIMSNLNRPGVELNFDQIVELTTILGVAKNIKHIISKIW